MKRVVALYRDAGGLWKSVEMSRGSSRWSGAGPLDGTDVEWLIQAVDGAGNIGITANKAISKSVVQQPPTGNIQAVATGPQTNGWFTGSPNPTVTISDAPGITHSLDGAPFTPGDSLTVSGTGVHTVGFQGSDGSHGSLAVPIDVSDPTVTVNATYGFGQVAHAVCADSGSGIATCNVPSTRHELGRDEDDPCPCRGSRRPLVRRQSHLRGEAVHVHRLLPPIDNLPTVNVVDAGSSVPIKFSLSGSVASTCSPRAIRVAADDL